MIIIVPLAFEGTVKMASAPGMPVERMKEFDIESAGGCVGLIVKRRGSR